MPSTSAQLHVPETEPLGLEARWMPVPPGTAPVVVTDTGAGEAPPPVRLPGPRSPSVAAQKPVSWCPGVRPGPGASIAQICTDGRPRPGAVTAPR